MGMTKKGQKVIVNRNCHRSILTGLIISGAEVIWVVPEQLKEWGIWGGVSPEQIKKLLPQYTIARKIGGLNGENKQMFDRKQDEFESLCKK